MKYKLNLEKSFTYANLLRVEGKNNIMIVEATSNYIPIEEFKEIFNSIGSSAAKQSITKLVFDKSKLTVFHQPSMEWYFVEWKEKMFDLGLKTHRKILPKDEVFKYSVKIGRDRIKQNFPNGKYTLMDIQYSESIDEAIDN
ncbi:MAG: hypothetical protein ACKVOU_01760 [Cytophagales bacterium]